MVFGRRSKTSTDDLDNWSEILDVYWEFLESLEIGTKVYLPLWDKEGHIADVMEEQAVIEGLLPNNEWLPVYPWEFTIL